MREPVDGDEGEGESGKRRSSGMGSINAEQASLGETPLDDETTESIRSDSNCDPAAEPSQMTSGNR